MSLVMALRIKHAPFSRSTTLRTHSSHSHHFVYSDAKRSSEMHTLAVHYIHHKLMFDQQTKKTIHKIRKYSKHFRSGFFSWLLFFVWLKRANERINFFLSRHWIFTRSVHLKQDPAKNGWLYVLRNSSVRDREREK